MVLRLLSFGEGGKVSFREVLVIGGCTQGIFQQSGKIHCHPPDPGRGGAQRRLVWFPIASLVGWQKLTSDWCSWYYTNLEHVVQWVMSFIELDEMRSEHEERHSIHTQSMCILKSSPTGKPLKHGWRIRTKTTENMTSVELSSPTFSRNHHLPGASVPKATKRSFATFSVEVWADRSSR